MKNIISMLGNSLIKKDKKLVGKSIFASGKSAKALRKKISVEKFLRNILGTRLIEKKR